MPCHQQLSLPRSSMRFSVLCSAMCKDSDGEKDSPRNREMRESLESERGDVTVAAFQHC